MQVVHDSPRLDLEGAHEVREGLAKEVEAGEVFEIAEVLALIGEAAARKGEDALQVAADGEQRRRFAWADRCRAARIRGRGA